MPRLNSAHSRTTRISRLAAAWLRDCRRQDIVQIRCDSAGMIAATCERVSRRCFRKSNRVLLRLAVMAEAFVTGGPYRLTLQASRTGVFRAFTNMNVSRTRIADLVCACSERVKRTKCTCPVSPQKSSHKVECVLVKCCEALRGLLDCQRGRPQPPHARARHSQQGLKHV